MSEYRNLSSEFKSLNDPEIRSMFANECEFGFSNDNFVVSTISDWRIFDVHGLKFTSFSNSFQPIIDLLISKSIVQFEYKTEQRTPIDLLFKFNDCLSIEIFSSTLFELWVCWVDHTFVEDGLLENSSVMSNYQKSKTPFSDEIQEYIFKDDSTLIIQCAINELHIPAPWRLVGPEGIIFGNRDAEGEFTDMKYIIGAEITGVILDQSKQFNDMSLIINNNMAIELFDCGQGDYIKLKRQLGVG